MGWPNTALSLDPARRAAAPGNARAARRARPPTCSARRRSPSGGRRQACLHPAPPRSNPCRTFRRSPASGRCSSATPARTALACRRVSLCWLAPRRRSPASWPDGPRCAAGAGLGRADHAEPFAVGWRASDVGGVPTRSLSCPPVRSPPRSCAAGTRTRWRAPRSWWRRPARWVGRGNGGAGGCTLSVGQGQVGARGARCAAGRGRSLPPPSSPPGSVTLFLSTARADFVWVRLWLRPRL